MLVLSLTYFNVITLHPFILLSSFYVFYQWSYISFFPKTRKPNFDSCNNPIGYCCELDGYFSNCISLYYWFIVARYLGLFHSLSPVWRPHGKSPTQFEPKIPKPRKPPDRYRRGCYVVFLLYLCIVFLNTKAVHSDQMSASSLSAIPLTIFSSFCFQAMHQRENFRTIGILFAPKNPIPNGPFIADPFIQLSNTGCTPCDATKLAMLSAWQSANADLPFTWTTLLGAKQFASIPEHLPVLATTKTTSFR